jgi:hypothetical protein
LENSTVDFSTLSYASESTPVKSSESLKAELQAVNKELDSMKKQWREEKRQLLGDNAVLKDAANRLNHQIRDTKERAEKTERRSEKTRNGVLGVWIRFRFSDTFFFAHGLFELAGAGSSETDDSGFGGGPQS